MRRNPRPSAGAGEPKTPEKSRAGGTAVAEVDPPRAAVETPAVRNRFLSAVIDFFTSLRLTVACLALGLVLVFVGTLAQVDLGLYKAQNEFFRSFLVFWGPKDAGWKIPVLPGGYLVGGVLLFNLIASHLKRFSLTRNKVGIWMVHFGLILLLTGQLLTDVFSRESALHLREGQAKNYSEAGRQAELAIIDATDPDTDKVVAISQGVLTGQREIRQADLPFTVRVKDFYANSVVEERPPNASAPPAATKDVGAHATVRELPRTTDMNERDVPSAVVELVDAPGSLGTWLVSEYVKQPQGFMWNNRTYRLELRPRRYYLPFSLQLQKFHNDLYAGTEIPKNYSSRVLLQRPETGEKREILIYMNNPLRYAGETFYQASYDPDNKGTILQVVRNPSWLTPYFSCVLVGAGLIVQFTTHLWGFSWKRRTV